jgi:hypothetical protein
VRPNREATEVNKASPALYAWYAIADEAPVIIA